MGSGGNSDSVEAADSALGSLVLSWPFLYEILHLRQMRLLNVKVTHNSYRIIISI